MRPVRLAMRPGVGALPAAVALLVALAGGGGCGAGAQVPCASLLDRVPRGTVHFGPASPILVRAWEFDEGAADGWRALLDAGPPRLEGGSLLVETTGVDPSLRCTVDLLAAAVDRIEIRLAVPDRNSPPRLYWMRESDDTFSEERSLGFLVPRDATLHDVTVPVGRHPLWRDRIVALRLDPSDLPGVRVAIDSIRALRVPEERERIDEVKIGREWRLCRLAPVGDAWEVPVKIPREGGVLDFGFGVDPWSWNKGGGGILFRVSVLGPEKGGGGGALLFQREIDPGRSPGDRRFFDARVELGGRGLPGSSVRLLFEVVGGEGADPATHLGLWADPRLLAPGVSPLPNLILVSLDTLRADHVSFLGDPRPTTPELDRFAREGTVFTRATSQAPETLASHMSLLTGRLPSAHGVFDDFDRLPEGVGTLAKAFRDKGYLTAAYTEGGYVAGSFGFRNGFRLYHDGSPRAELPEGDPRRVAGGDARRTFDRALAWLGRFDAGPFFLFVHTYEIHTPYSPPVESRRFCDPDYDGPYRLGFDFKPDAVAINARVTTPTPADRRQVLDLYDSEIAYCDAQIGRLRSYLRRRGLLGRTVLVFLSDHGEEFGEHGGFAIHGNSLFQEEIHVPLVLCGPRIPPGRRVDDPVGLVDLFPTLGSLFGLEAPRNLDGVSLLARIQGGRDGGGRGGAGGGAGGSEDGTHFRRYAIRRGDRKLILTDGIEAGLVDRICRQLPSLGDLYFRFDKVALYDLSRDPRETRNLAPARPAERASLEGELRRLAERCRAVHAGFRSARGGAAGLPDGDRARLRALGYLPEEEAGSGRLLSAEEAQRRCEARRR